MTEGETTTSSIKPTSLLERIKEFDEMNSEKIHTMEMDEHTNIFLYLSEKFYRPICLIVYLVLVLIYYLIKKKNPFYILKPIIHFGVVHYVTPLLQSLIQRPKPKWKETIKKPHSLTAVAQQFSMPCEEVMQASNFAIFLLCSFGNFAGMFLIPLIMIGKIYYSYYYIFDTIVSAVLGAIISLFLYFGLFWF